MRYEYSKRKAVLQLMREWVRFLICGASAKTPPYSGGVFALVTRTGIEPMLQP